MMIILNNEVKGFSKGIFVLSRLYGKDYFIVKCNIDWYESSLK